MRFIVEFYRYAILGGIAVFLVGLVFITLVLANGAGGLSEVPITVFVIGASALILYVLSLGMMATFISIHDRHAELANDIRVIRELYEARQEQ